MTQQFTYYLHDDATRGERRETLEAQGVELSEEAWEKLGRPFYEIGLKCEVDEYGVVKILGVIP
jgi:hypothetical protein